MNIIVLGAGAFGTAIANELSVNTDNKVLLYSRNQKKVDEINNYNTNTTCFPNKRLTKNLHATTDSNSISSAEIILIALPSNVVMDSLSSLRPYFNKDVLLVNLSKGLLESGTSIVEKIKVSFKTDNIVTLKGPSFSSEVIEHADTILTLGYSTKKQYDIINTI